MATFNKITIVGYLGRDPEMKYTPNGDAVCSFSVATTEKQKDNEHTTWFRITTWRRQAEVCQQYLSKGKQVYIEGRLRTNEYTDRDGNKRTSLEVNATDIQFLGSSGNAESSDDSRPGKAIAQQSAANRQARPSAPAVEDDSDSIPF